VLNVLFIRFRDVKALAVFERSRISDVIYFAMILSHVTDNGVGLKLDGALTVHAFRKSCGQNGVETLPMNAVKEFMGHAEIKTTAEFDTVVSSDHVEWARRAIEAITMKARTKTDAKVTPEPKTDPVRRAG